MITEIEALRLYNVLLRTSIAQRELALIEQERKELAAAIYAAHGLREGIDNIELPSGKIIIGSQPIVSATDKQAG